MNRVTYIPRGAERTARTLRRWCDANRVSFEFLPVNGAGHPAIRVEHNRQSRKMSFSATPSDKRRGSMNALSQLKRLMRDMGWKAQKPTENKPMRMASQSLSKFDSRAPSMGAASECKVTRIKPVTLAGVEFPTCPSDYRVIRGPKNPFSKIVAKRNAAMLEAKQAGARDPEIHKALCEAGWQNVKPGSISSLITQEKRRQGLPTRPHNIKSRKPEPVEDVEGTRAVELPATDDAFVIEIAAAIAPIVAKHISSSKSLKEKADKWDAIRDLIGQDAA